MKSPNTTELYMYAVIAAGFVCLATAFYAVLPFERWDWGFICFALFTIGLGSRISVQLPRFKSHVTVSDTFIFLTLFLFGGEAAIILAAVEAFASAWRFCKRKLTVFFNAAVMTISLSAVVYILRFFQINPAAVLPENDSSTLIISLSVTALLSFIVNTGLASVYGALKSEKPWWETWKTMYLWTSPTYFVGAISAGILIKLVHSVGFAVLLAVAPVIVIVYLTYRMYLKNVEMVTVQAEQAKEYADALEKQSVALRQSEGRFRSAFDFAPIGIALVSPAGKWLKVNQALSKILGYSERQFLASDFQSMIFAEDLGESLIKVHELLSGKAVSCQCEQRYLNKRGEIVWVSWSGSTAMDAEAERPNLIFQMQDITDRRLAAEQLEYKATHDALTGLPNRAMFMSCLNDALNERRENRFHRVSVMFIDLDRFKVVNDSLGHQIGDELLNAISVRLRDCVRPSDLVARLGGDEFTILIEGSHEPKEVERIAERIRENFLVGFNLSGHEIFSSASIGILHASERHAQPEDLMRDADIAMYHAKHGGKARHEVFNQNMSDAAREAMEVETDLRRAIEKQEFCVFYQPIYCFGTDRIEGFEALARWNHKTHGLISPDKFIPLAEEIGVIDALGEQILRQACEEGRRIRELMPEVRDSFKLSVNISCKQFAQPKFIENIKKILDDTGFNPHHLKLEITESVFLENSEKVMEILRRLREIGIEIYLDDFGMGYSNLRYLTQFPISTLKIDRSFVSPIQESGQNIEILQTIVTLARNLQMKVIAEGIETNTQLRQIKDLNCQGGQGYFIGKPMRFESVAKFIKNKTAKSESVVLLRLPKTLEEISVVSTVQ